MGTTSAPGTSQSASPCPGTQGWAGAISTQFNSIQNNTFYLLSAYTSQMPCDALAKQMKVPALRELTIYWGREALNSFLNYDCDRACKRSAGC